MGNIGHNSCGEELGQACEQEHVILAWLGRRVSENEGSTLAYTLEIAN